MPADLESLLRTSTRIASVLDDAPTYRFQVLFSEPAADGHEWRRREGVRTDAEYFYPASAIKTAVAVAALETLTELREHDASGADGSQQARARLGVGSLFGSDRRRGPAVSVEMLLQGALVMSDNDASNDLLDLAGFDGVHERMWRTGLSSVRVRHRLGVRAREDSRSAARVVLQPPGNVGPVVVAPRDASLPLGKNEEPGVSVGESYLVHGRVVEQAMSFEEKNRISLVDLQDLLVAIMRPDLRGADEQLHLGDAERTALVEALTMLPSRRGLKPSEEVSHKPLLPGLERVVPRASLTLASKGGRSYGFVVENAYVADARTGRSFFLTVALYANANGRLNDDLYEYDDIAFPVLADVGEIIARHVFEDPS